MKYKKLTIFTAVTSMLLGASAASAGTAYCYKHPGNNNGHRYVLNYRAQGYDIIIERWTRQEWDGKRYRDHSWLNTGRTYSWAPNNVKWICKKYLKYNYAHGG